MIQQILILIHLIHHHKLHANNTTCPPPQLGPLSDTDLLHPLSTYIEASIYLGTLSRQTAPQDSLW